MPRFSPLFASLIVITAPALAQNTLADVQAHLNAVTTMSAHFTQIDRNGKTLTGELKLKRPGHIRFEYQKDAGILVVANGKTLNFIDYKVNQVSAWPIGHSPLAVLLDPSRDISGIAKVIPAPDPKVTLVEAKDTNHPEYGVITLGFAHQASAPAGLLLQGWVTEDSQGNRTIIRLSNQTFNQPLSDEAFAWRDPRNVNSSHR